LAIARTAERSIIEAKPRLMAAVSKARKSPEEPEGLSNAEIADRLASLAQMLSARSH
jgi:hypothetical protein